jgi:hypothetical protein
MFKAKAQIHSLNAQDEVLILHENGNNDVVVAYNGNRYTAVYNVFVGLYYVDDIYGLLRNQNICPRCGEIIAENGGVRSEL